jgi:hypothetical protein
MNFLPESDEDLPPENMSDTSLVCHLFSRKAVFYYKQIGKTIALLLLARKSVVVLIILTFTLITAYMKVPYPT